VLGEDTGSVERADKFVDAITQRLAVLAHTPKAGTVRAEIALGLRALPVEDCIVYYRENKR